MSNEITKIGVLVGMVALVVALPEYLMLIRITLIIFIVAILVNLMHE